MIRKVPKFKKTYNQIQISYASLKLIFKVNARLEVVKALHMNWMVSSSNPIGRLVRSSQQMLLRSSLWHLG